MGGIRAAGGRAGVILQRAVGGYACGYVIAQLGIKLQAFIAHGIRRQEHQLVLSLGKGEGGVKLALGLVFAGEKHYEVALRLHGDLRECPLERIVHIITQETA